MSDKRPYATQMLDRRGYVTAKNDCKGKIFCRIRQGGGGVANPVFFLGTPKVSARDVQSMFRKNVEKIHAKF